MYYTIKYLIYPDSDEDDGNGDMSEYIQKGLVDLFLFGVLAGGAALIGTNTDNTRPELKSPPAIERRLTNDGLPNKVIEKECEKR